MRPFMFGPSDTREEYNAKVMCVEIFLICGLLKLIDTDPDGLRAEGWVLMFVGSNDAVGH